MSIIRIGLGENKKYGDGWESIFGSGTPAKEEKKPAKKKPAKAAAKRPAAKKKKATKKK